VRVNPDTIFGKIVAGEVPADKVYETETVLAFRDLSPQAPVHVLVIPKTPYQNAAELATAEPALLGELIAAAHEVATKTGVAESGYRLVVNTGKDANQTVDHLHVHVLGGRAMSWPPG
jgi:histidine triad (HIT) family protein